LCCLRRLMAMTTMTAVTLAAAAMMVTAKVRMMVIAAMVAVMAAMVAGQRQWQWQQWQICAYNPPSTPTTIILTVAWASKG
jgi:hypothetical protein